MTRLALCLLLATLAGCERQPVITTLTGNFAVDKLFTVDGCSVYRFTDSGWPRYFTDCRGTAEWTEPCGSDCYRPNGVEGGRRNEERYSL